VITMLSQRDGGLGDRGVPARRAGGGSTGSKATFPGDEPLPGPGGDGGHGRAAETRRGYIVPGPWRCGGPPVRGESDPKGPDAPMICPGTVVFPRTARALEASCAIRQAGLRVSWLRWGPGLASDSRIAGYWLEEQIGQGGMAVVFPGP